MDNMFAKNLKYLLNTNKLTVNKILELTKIKSPSLIYMWKSGDRFITTENAVILGNYLGVTIDDLLNHDLKELESQFDSLKELFIQNYNLLTDDDKDTIRFIIEKRVKEEYKQ